MAIHSHVWMLPLGLHHLRRLTPVKHPWYAHGMTEKQFSLDAGTFTVFISYFQGPVPGRLYGPPEDCYPDEPAIVEFTDEVSLAAEEGIAAKSMTFDDFVKLYAKELTEGDEDKALDRIENETITEVLEYGP